MEKLMNFIGGEPSAPSSGAWFQHRNPSTGDVAVEVPDSGMLDLVKAIQASNKAWATWQKTGLKERASFLTKISDALTEASEGLARAQSRDHGVPIARSRESIEKAARVFRFYASQIEAARESSVLTPQALFVSNRLPIGVVGLITPWSDPLLHLARKTAAALAAGNVIIAKPSEFSPEAASGFANAIHRSGLPPGVFNLVHGRGEEVGAAMVAHPGLSTLSFTGRTETGRSVLRDSAEFLKRTQLALGARNPVLVFAETSLEKTIPLIVSSCMSFESSTCLRGSRLFVQESIYDRFLDLFKAEVEKMKIGDPLLGETALGPLVSEAEKARYHLAVEQAIGEKGKVLCGGSGFPQGLDERLSKGWFVQPTVVYDLTLCSTLQQEEIIGPFVTVASFKYQHEAIKHANTSPFAQAAYIFEPLADKAMRVATKIEASRIYLNSAGPLHDDRVDISGMKTSGLGWEGAEESLKFFSRVAQIAQNLST